MEKRCSLVAKELCHHHIRTPDLLHNQSLPLPLSSSPAKTIAPSSLSLLVFVLLLVFRLFIVLFLYLYVIRSACISPVLLGYMLQCCRCRNCFQRSDFQSICVSDLYSGLHVLTFQM